MLKVSTSSDYYTSHHTQSKTAADLVRSYFKKETMLTKEQFFDMMNDELGTLHKLESKYHDEIAHAPAEFTALKSTLLEEAWDSYKQIVTLIDREQVLFSNYLSAFTEGFRPTAFLSMLGLSEFIREPLDKFTDLKQNLPKPSCMTVAETINLPRILYSSLQKPEGSIPYLVVYGTHLTIAIACTSEKEALAYIDAGADVNKYALCFGNNPLLIAVSKGWNRCDPVGGGHQKAIIQRLLNVENLDINARHLCNGMTALHIACLLGDAPELVEHLILRGADVTIEDYQGKTPLDYLDFTEDAARTMFYKLHEYTADQKRDMVDGGPPWTRPSSEERSRNIEVIREKLTEVLSHMHQPRM